MEVRMPLATLTTKGQVTIPKPVRDALGIQAGDRVQFLIREDGVVQLLPQTRDLLSLAGILVPRVTGVTVEGMDEAIGQAVVDELERSR